MHHRQVVAVIILVGDHIIAENLARPRYLAVFMDNVFIRHIVIVAENAVGFDLVVQKPVVVRARHPVVQQIFVHHGVHRASVGQVQRQKPLFIENVRLGHDAGVGRVKILRRLALDKDCIGPHL